MTVFVENDEYVLLHSPANGIGIKRSKDIENWIDDELLITLGQDEWTWARGRLAMATASRRGFGTCARWWPPFADLRRRGAPLS